MENEGKYRGWIQKADDAGHWVYGALIGRHDDGTCVIADDECEWTVVDVGKYTGMNDIHGVEIYEGDMLLSTAQHFTTCGVVVFDSGAKIKVGGTAHYMTAAVWQNVEVVGNIHRH